MIYLKLLPLLVIVGPTAVGKTNVGIQLAKTLEGEIISADSMQVYKQLDIGTAKITSAESGGIPHHLINIKEPWENFSVAEYQSLAEQKIIEICSRNKFPILLGGTGLYINSFISDYNFTPTTDTSTIRKNLWEIVEQEGTGELFNKLSKIDPASATKIHPNDAKRIIRALEVYYTLGQPISSFAGSKGSDKYNTTIIGLNMDRDFLYQRINQRVELMLKRGWLEEVKILLDAGISPESPALQGLGYKQLIMFLNKQISYEEAVEIIKRDTRRYAKRQITWFKRTKGLIWIDVTGKEDTQIVEEILPLIGRSI